jgi:hypothetical protein
MFPSLPPIDEKKTKQQQYRQQLEAQIAERGPGQRLSAVDQENVKETRSNNKDARLQQKDKDLPGSMPPISTKNMHNVDYAAYPPSTQPNWGPSPARGSYQLNGASYEQIESIRAEIQDMKGVISALIPKLGSIEVVERRR